jgi:Glucose-6-phosphate dehydrogenase subunit
MAEAGGGTAAGGGATSSATAVAGGGTAVTPGDLRPGQPTLRWSSRAHTLDDIQRELTKIWARPPGAVPAGEDAEPHVAARTSVLNLVVIVRRPEIGQRAAATIAQLTGRHPSRTLIVSSTDPDGPSWLDAQIQAFCVIPRQDAPETCAEMIYLTCGGDAGRHLQSLVAALLIHDLPVTLWWPGEPAFGSPAARELIDMADRLVVDGSTWNGNGIAKLRELARLADKRIALSDFGLMRQMRWREAIAATFDVPEFTPFLRSIRRIAVTYATHDDAGDPDITNVVKPVYHVAWIAGRLGMRVESPLMPVRKGARAPDAAVRRARSGTAGTSRPGPAPIPGGFDGRLRHGAAEVDVVLRPRLSPGPPGTTLRVELLAERRGSELRADVTAEAEAVHCRVWQDGVDVLERRFNSPRMVDVNLLAEAIEITGDDRIERETIRMAGLLVTPITVGGEPQ